MSGGHSKDVGNWRLDCCWWFLRSLSPQTPSVQLDLQGGIIDHDGLCRLITVSGRASVSGL